MKKSEKKRKKRKNRLEFRFALFRFEAKITQSKRSKKFKVKKAKKSEKKWKKRKKAKKAKKSEKKWKKQKSAKKQKNRLEFRFALFHFEAKITKVKRSEKFAAKRSEKREVKFYSEIVKHKWNGSKFALFRL